MIILFAWRRKEVHTSRDIVRNVVLPALGVFATMILWVNLSPESFAYGFIWLLIGIAIMLLLTRFWTRPMRIVMEEEDMPPMDELYEAIQEQERRD